MRISSPSGVPLIGRRFYRVRVKPSRFGEDRLNGGKAVAQFQAPGPRQEAKPSCIPAFQILISKTSVR